MKKLPAYLNGLVNTRARSAGDIERLEQLRKLLDEEIALARRRLAAADTLIRDFNPLLDPTQIQPIQPRKGRYGKVKETIQAVLQAAAPRALPTIEVAFLVAEEAGIRFHGEADFRSWAHNTIRRELGKHFAAGTVERLPPSRGEETRWRAAVLREAQSLSELHAIGAAQRVP